VDERDRITAAIAALETQRALLGDAVVDAARAPLEARLAVLGRGQAVQRKQITVLFADVSGFTALCGRLDPEVVRERMNGLWARLDQAIEAHGGIVDKHIGDAVMALFGATTAREDDAERAVRCALDMQVCVADVADVVAPGRGGEELLRIGLHTGPVVLGTVGRTAEYTAMGDTVNVASRLEQEAPAGGILISEETQKHVRGLFELLPLEPLHLKGKSKPMPAWLVEGARPRAFRLSTRGVEGVVTPLVGRRGEMAALTRALQEVEAGHGAASVTVLGDAGIGKSRLLAAFDDWLEGRPEPVRLFKARARLETGRTSYALLRDLCAFRFDIREGDPIDTARTRLLEGMRGFLGAAGDVEAHLLGHLLGIDVRGNLHLAGVCDDPRQLRRRAFGALERLLSAACADMPAVVLLEDLHWADDGSLEALLHLREALADRPVLFVGLSRPELETQFPRWVAPGPRARTIRLHPLEHSDCVDLVHRILHRVSALPASLVARIADAAEGNPFYVEEIVKVLIQDGVVEKSDAAWHVHEARLVDLKVPSTLTALLQARLESLPQAERTLLQRASVVGRVFWADTLDGLEEAGLALSTDATGLAADVARDALLAELVSQELIFPLEPSAFPGTAAYVFKHAILHEVVYESVLLDLRRAWHGRTARWLADHGDAVTVAWAGRIAEHLERAGCLSEAASWYARAGHQSRETYALAEAEILYRRARALLTGERVDRRLRARILSGLGEVLRWRARLNEAIEVFEALRADAVALADASLEAEAWLGLATGHHLLGRYREVQAASERGASVARDAGLASLEARALARQGWAVLGLGDPETALALGDDARTRAEAAADAEAQARALQLLGNVHAQLGDPEAAERCQRAVLALERERGDRLGEANALNDLGEGARGRADFQAAYDLYRQALEIYEDAGERMGILCARHNLAGAQVGLGDGTGARRLLETVLADPPDGWFGLPETYRFLAEACLLEGDLETALDAARRSLTLATDVESAELVGIAWRVLGEIAARLGRPIRLAERDHEASLCFERSLSLLEGAGLEAEADRTRKSLAAAGTRISRPRS
jgi:class 3 adenylate cyclase/tetratricopeptide (TPR) repeat protein